MLLMLSLFSLLIVAALISETSRLLERDSNLYVLCVVDLCAVVVFPLVIGIVLGCELHSILAMISLSAAIQILLLQTTAAVPSWLLMTMAAITLPGIPLGLALVSRRIDRLSEIEDIETTSGKLLVGKQRRKLIRQRRTSGQKVDR